MAKRVVVTGMGIVCPLACGVEASWKRLIAGESGIRRISHFPAEDLPARIAGIVPTSKEESADFWDVNEYVDIPTQNKTDKFIQLALSATQQALTQAHWPLDKEIDQERTGVLVGAGIGGLPKIYENSVAFFQKGARFVSPFFVPSAIINLASGHISIRHKVRGPNHAVVTACSSGSHALGDAARLIREGYADVMIAGGAESTIFPFGIAGFAAARALSTGFNDDPTRASRPWDKDRDGFVLGEGAGILILEELEHAQARGAPIHAEIIGYGLSGDAFHVTAPSTDGRGAVLSMTMALSKAGLAPENIDYINAHGTSTYLGDLVEARAIKQVFGKYAYKDLAISSTKSAIGHLLGGAGAVEAIFSLLAIRDRIIPPTLNLDTPGEECDLDFVPHVARKKELRYVMSNSFGFGGTNVSLIFQKWEP
jgi:3-oxoacyl-[acyl-carrier-protein] synthase II